MLLHTYTHALHCHTPGHTELLTWHPIPVHGIHLVFSLCIRVVEKLLADSTGALWSRELSQVHAQ